MKIYINPLMWEAQYVLTAQTTIDKSIHKKKSKQELLLFIH